MKRPKPPPNDNKLLNALKALSLVIDNEKPHILLKNHWAIAESQYGVLSAGVPIENDLFACPNGLMLKDALSKCGQNISITQLDQNISIKSDKFKALIPCLPVENFSVPFPDASQAQLDDRLKASLLAVSPLALNETAVVTASVLIHAGTVTATDRKVILQAWHGIDLPPMLALPKSIIKPLTKNDKKLIGFGFSQSSCTFHFEDGSWLKSQYFAEQWPNINHILDRQANAWPIPEDFFIAIKSLEPFSDSGFIYCDNGVMRSHEEDGIGASHEVYGLPKGPVLNIKQLKMVEPYIKTIDFLVAHNGHKMTLFYGDKIRGAIAGRIS